MAGTLLFAGFVSSECQAAAHARHGLYIQFTTGAGLPHFAITADDSVIGPPDHYASSQSGVSDGGSLLQCPGEVAHQGPASVTIGG